MEWEMLSRYAKIWGLQVKNSCGNGFNGKLGGGNGISTRVFLSAITKKRWQLYANYKRMKQAIVYVPSSMKSIISLGEVEIGLEISMLSVLWGRRLMDLEHRFCCCSKERTLQLSSDSGTVCRFCTTIYGWKDPSPSFVLQESCWRVIVLGNGNMWADARILMHVTS